ncbi:zinc finger protein jing homolog isoform X2 [Nilaparvata lugens]|uniref:zinc finger protein jing homolog isoform X2 n=1 Tax=Nilaparvata lugens TaxID=108931 RepID=UPI00193D30C0|nr:zinc finger protein jing homolog isoform X2 [Nilaparvata lugens]
MADGHCAAELDVREDEPTLLMNGKGGSSSDSECVADEDRSGSLSKSFYVSGDLCSDIVSNGAEEFDVESSGLLNEICRVMGSEHVEFSGDFKEICSEGEDNCRKKRCADRYDSSESSDSGVAVLSCTDCSGSSSSSSSSGTSDITDPGSPFSSASSHSSNSESDPENTVLSKMPPWLTGLTGLEGSSALKRFQLLDQCASAAKRKLTLDADDEGYAGENGSSHATKTLLVFLSGSAAAASAKQVTGILGPGVLGPTRKKKNFGISICEQQEQPQAQQAKSPRIAADPPFLATASDPPFLAAASDPPLTVFRQPEPEPPDDDDEEELDEEEEDLDLEEDDECRHLVPSAPEPPPAAMPPPPPMPLPLPPPSGTAPSPPRTIRFPARSGTSPAWKGHHFHRTDIACRWSGCHHSFATSLALIEHLQVQHINTQSLSETFVCLWVGCKVFEKASCSRSWLERHVLSHGGNKPYRCIVDGCGQRFSSQIMLQRHVNGHFNQTDSNGSGSSGSRKSLETAPNKLFRRNGKKLRYRRQPFSARIFDYFDAGTMEKLQQKLIEVTESEICEDMDQIGSNYLTLHSKILGQRTELDGTTSFMLRWYPSNIVNDEWVNEKNVVATRQVPLSRVPVDSEYTTALLLNRHRRRRKQTPTPTPTPPVQR